VLRRPQPFFFVIEVTCPRCSAPLDGETPVQALLVWVHHSVFSRADCIGCTRPGCTTVGDVIAESIGRRQLH